MEFGAALFAIFAVVVVGVLFGVAVKRLHDARREDVTVDPPYVPGGGTYDPNTPPKREEKY